MQTLGKTQKIALYIYTAFRLQICQKCASVKANSVLRASLTSGFWDIYFKTVTSILLHENTLQTCYHQKDCF